MKRFLLATAAVIALAVAAPIATAQYTTPPPAMSTPAPVTDDPGTPQDESAQPAQSQVTTPGTPETSEPMPSTTAQTQALDATTQAQTTTTPDTTHAETHTDSTQAQTDTGVETAQTTEPAPEAEPTAVAENSTMDMAALEQHARDAGMDGMPMTAQAVCAPREISLTTSGSRLSRDKQHQLINAADRASVCDIQRVVINSPNGRADAARQLLIDHGVSGSMIEVQDGDAAGLEVEMQFTGIATSSDQYAQLFNPQQLASADTSTAAPSYTPSPSAPPAPDATTPDSTAPADPSMQTPEPDPLDDTPEDGVAPT